jgi:two-component system sensor histidine kinase KdpD
VIAQHASTVFGGGAAVLLAGESGAPLVRARAGADFELGEQELEAARWVHRHGRPAGATTETHQQARVLCAALTAGPEAHGVLALSPGDRAPLLGEQRSFFDAFLRQAALALERARLAETAKATALRARTEELRSSLLSAVSHDLRTPLAAITGAATTVRDRRVRAGAAREEIELLDAVCEEADRLERLLANLLDMTRLESGAFEVRRDWVPLEEIVGAALGRLESQLAGRPVELDLPPELPLLSVDAVLLQQVFFNLLENATKYTPSGSAISISAHQRDRVIEVAVADRGPGVTAGNETRVFEKFVRDDSGAGRGVGLGLAICRGIIEAHGGGIEVENRPGGGALFRLWLPLVGEMPMLPIEEEAS